MKLVCQLFSASRTNLLVVQFEKINATHLTEETQIKSQIKDYLDLKGIFHFPILQGLGAAKGLPDRIAVGKDGKFIAIEVKAKKGQLSTYQKLFRDRLTAAGGVYIEARCLEDVMNLV